MADEVKKEEFDESVSEFVDTVSLEDIISEAEVHYPEGQEPKKPEPTEQKADDSKEEPTTEKKEEAPESKADADKPEQQEVSKPKPDEELPEEQQLWKKAWENREEWEKTLKQKSQAIAKLQKLSPDQQELLYAKVMPYVYGEEKIPDTPDELIVEAVGKLGDIIPENITLQDEDGVDVIVSKEHYEPIVKKAAGEIIKRYLPELTSIRSDYQKLNDDYSKAVEETHQLATLNGEIVLDHFGQQYADALPTKVNDKERPSQALRRVMESGDDHPEYYKVLRCKAAAELRGEMLQKGKDVSFQNAFEILYGTDYRKAKQKEQIDKEIIEKQKEVQPESPGQAVQKSEADTIVEEVFGGESHEEAVGKFFNN